MFSPFNLQFELVSACKAAAVTMVNAGYFEIQWVDWGRNVSRKYLSGTKMLKLMKNWEKLQLEWFSADRTHFTFRTFFGFFGTISCNLFSEQPCY